MMSWTAAYESDAPAWYYVNPPEASWDDEAKDEWRSMFSATTLPAITAHEVTPGHYAHGRMIRQLAAGEKPPELPDAVTNYILQHRLYLESQLFKRI